MPTASASKIVRLSLDARASSREHKRSAWVRTVSVGSSLAAAAMLTGLISHGPNATGSPFGAPSEIPSITQKEETALLQDSEKVRHALTAFSSRQTNWDGDGGLVPSDRAMADARAFIACLQHAKLTYEPEVYAPGDGEVVFQWRVSNGFIEAAFVGDGTISWSARAAGEPAQFGDDEFDHNSPIMPKPLFQAIGNLI